MMATNLRNIFNRDLSFPLEEPVRQHLKNVYACLTLSGISAALGVSLHFFTNFSLGILASGLLVLGLMIALVSTPHNEKNTPLRLSYLLGSSFFSGMGMVSLIDYALQVNPSLILTALMGTCIIFACLTLSVFYSRRGHWLFIGPVSALSSMAILFCLGFFFDSYSYWIHQMQSCILVLVMCGFLVFDSTRIIEKCRMGDKDFVLHALDLFVDFIGIFKRILIILTEKERYARERKRN